MDWKGLFMHLINLSAAIVLALKGKDNFAMFVLGGAFGIAAPQAITNRMRNVGDKALEAATSVVNKAGMLLLVVSLTGLAVLLLGVIHRG